MTKVTCTTKAIHVYLYIHVPYIHVIYPLVLASVIVANINRYNDSGNRVHVEASGREVCNVEASMSFKDFEVKDRCSGLIISFGYNSPIRTNTLPYMVSYMYYIYM